MRAKRRVQVPFPLRRPEEFDWTQDEEFNAVMHEQLMTAHRLVATWTPADDKRLEAELILRKLRERTLSRRQAMFRYFLLAQCARAHDISQSRYILQPLQWSERAEYIAAALLDRGSQVNLHELRGTLHRAVSLYGPAAEEFSVALHLLRELAGDRESADADYEVTLASKAATMAYFAGDIPGALEHARRAKRLLHLAKPSVEGRGTLAWTFALLQRQRNDLAEAMHHAAAAVRLYRRVGTTNSTCRILCLAAEIAMDAADSSLADLPGARKRLLAQAARYLQEGYQIGRAARDGAGLQMIELGRVRLERLTFVENAAEREKRLRSVQAFAQRNRDDSLLVAMQTAMGSDLLARGLARRGTTWLKKAVATADEIGSIGLAFAASRLLRKAEGRNV